MMPSLSIVLATTHPWPQTKPTLDAILSEPLTEMEVILCDGAGGAGAPPAGAYDERLKVLSLPDESVFALRAAGIARAGGEIVAITEDHCLPAPGWPRELLAAHERHPEAVAIAGAVTNDADDDPWDWANFLLTFAEHLPPMPAKATVRAPSVANASVRRAAAGLPREPAPGWFETALMGRLMAEGSVARDDGPRVSHAQSHGGPWRTLVAHFHNGRATAGLRAHPPGRRALAAERSRIVRLPLRLTREVRAALADRPALAGVAARGRRRVALVAVAHTAGEVMGLLAGSGRSAELLD